MTPAHALSFVIDGPPNAHPETGAISASMPSRLASLTAWITSAAYSFDRKLIFGALGSSTLRGKTILTPPNPAL